jgi:hypothetical protein
MNYFMTANGKSVLAAFAIDRIDNQCFYIADLALSFADTSKILCQPCSSGYYFIHLVTDGNKHLIRGMEKLIDMQRNRGEIVLIRQQRILLVVLMSSVGPAIMFLQAAAIALSRYYEQMRAIREGFIGSYHPDEFFSRDSQLRCHRWSLVSLVDCSAGDALPIPCRLCVSHQSGGHSVSGSCLLVKLRASLSYPDCLERDQGAGSL